MHGNWVRFPSMLAMPSAEPPGCRSRAQAVRGARSISAAAAARRSRSPVTPARPTRSAISRRTRRAAQPPARRHPCGVARDGRPESVARASPVSANGLAAAAAEIDLPPRTACARLLHPGGSAEGIEGRRIRPDVGERVLAHRPEFKTGNGLGSVAVQHLARRRHVQRAAPSRRRMASETARNSRARPRR